MQLTANSLIMNEGTKQAKLHAGMTAGRDWQSSNRHSFSPWLSLEYRVSIEYGLALLRRSCLRPWACAILCAFLFFLTTAAGKAVCFGGGTVLSRSAFSCSMSARLSCSLCSIAVFDSPCLPCTESHMVLKGLKPQRDHTTWAMISVVAD